MSQTIKYGYSTPKCSQQTLHMPRTDCLTKLSMKGRLIDELEILISYKDVYLELTEIEERLQALENAY